MLNTQKLTLKLPKNWCPYKTPKFLHNINKINKLKKINSNHWYYKKAKGKEQYSIISIAMEETIYR